MYQIENGNFHGCSHHLPNTILGPSRTRGMRNAYQCPFFIQAVAPWEISDQLKEDEILWVCHVHGMIRYLGSHWKQISSVQELSHVQLFVTPWKHARLPCPSPIPGVCSSSCRLSRWCHPTISSSFVPFSSHLQSFPASGSFQMSQFSASGDQRIGVSASASVLPINIQDWSPLAWTGWISLQSKGLSRVFSNTTVSEYSIMPRLILMSRRQVF